MEDHLQQTACLICNADDPTPLLHTPAHMTVNSTDTFQFVQCTNCQLVYLNPQLKPGHLSDYYPSYYLPYRGPDAWGRYREFAALGQNSTDLKRVKLVRQYLAKKQHPAVLDVGCGKPTFLAKLYQKTGARATGIDFSNSGWKDDPERWQHLHLVKKDPLHFKPDQAYDVITMWHYLEHDYHPKKTLAKLLEAAHDNTRLIIEVPDFDSLSRKQFGPYWEGFHAPRHTAVYDQNTLSKLIDNSGWQVEKYWKYGTLDAYALWWMSRMEKQNIDWRRSMEPFFPGFLAGKVATLPLFLLKRWLRLGVQMAVATPQRK